jgi:hypothetical protein
MVARGVRSIVASSVAAAAFFGQAAARVDCGGHFKDSCDQCPDGNGQVWCNGQCAWLGPTEMDGLCIGKITIPGILPEDSPLGAEFFYWAGVAGPAFVGTLLFAIIFYFRAVKSDTRADMPHASLWDARPARRSLFECFKHKETLVHVLFCLPVVAGKNMHIADNCGGYWPATLVYLILMYGPWSVFGAWGALWSWLAVVTIRTIFSVQFYKGIGLKPQIARTFFFSAFCFPCDLGRESLEADAEIGIELGWCCEVTYVPRAFVEGENLLESAAQKTRNCTTRVCGGST